MKKEAVLKVYNSYAVFYDFVFGRILQPGRKLTVDCINRRAPVGAKVLEVGVGTGLSLPYYRPDLKITAFDLSEEMLQKAEKRIKMRQLKTEINLLKMDADNLQFADNSFDYVVAMYVASVVPDIRLFLSEICRVCKPNGEIVILNHFRSENACVRALEKKLTLLNSYIGFEPNFSIDALLNFERLSLLESLKTNMFGYWKLLRFKKVS